MNSTRKETNHYLKSWMIPKSSFIPSNELLTLFVKIAAAIPKERRKTSNEWCRLIELISAKFYRTVILPLVAKYYRPSNKMSHHTFYDMIQTGYQAVAESIDTYDPSRSSPTTYLTRMIHYRLWMQIKKETRESTTIVASGTLDDRGKERKKIVPTSVSDKLIVPPEASRQTQIAKYFDEILTKSYLDTTEKEILIGFREGLSASEVGARLYKLGYTRGKTKQAVSVRAIRLFRKIRSYEEVPLDLFDVI